MARNNNQDWYIELEREKVLADPVLKRLPLEAVGLWLYMLLLMHGATRKGYLCDPIDGKAMSTECLASLLGRTEDVVSRTLKVITDSPLFSVSDDGILFSRGMVRREEIRNKRKVSGKLGGDKRVLLEQTRKQNSTKELRIRISESDLSSSLEEEDKDCVLDTTTPGYGGVGERDLLKQNSSKTENGELSPAWLARVWVDLRKGVKSRDELTSAKEFFEELIRLGPAHTAEEIAKEIAFKDRRKTETLWVFEKRMINRLGVTGESYDWLNEFVDRGESSDKT